MKMLMIDPKLIRWINASINVAFDGVKGSNPLYIEGQEIVVDPTKTEWAELHVSVGPEINETSSNSFEVDLIVTLMCSAIYSKDDYAIHKICGVFLPVLTGCIDVSKRGDDASFVGTLQPVGKLKVQPWGPVQLTVDAGPLRVKQQSLEQSFHMSF